jgi:tripartite ATP-independent transporter DctM subunit
MSVTLIAIIVMVTFFILFLAGVPVFLCLGFSGFIGIFLTRGSAGLFQTIGAISTQLDSFVLVAVPLFILMGQVIFITGVGSQIFELLSKWLNRVPGGLAVSSVWACAVFGAMSGVSVAGVATIGVVAVPEMIARGYRRDLVAGSVASAGALAMLIPPSVAFIIYGDLAEVSVGKLFIGGIIPGVVLALFMTLYIIGRVLKNPSLAPRMIEHVSWKERIVPLKYLWSPVFLIVAVLGTIYSGIATPTEASAIGAGGAFIIAGFAFRAINRKALIKIMSETTRVTAAILIIVACATVFSGYLSLARIPASLSTWVVGLELPPMVVLFALMILLIVLGCFVDVASVIIISTPILLPIILKLGFDPLWYGIVLVINLEMAVITPPVGLNLYALKSIAPDIEMGDIIKGILPFVAVEFACLVLFLLFPELSLWLPGKMK